MHMESLKSKGWLTKSCTETVCSQKLLGMAIFLKIIIHQACKLSNGDDNDAGKKKQKVPQVSQIVNTLCGNCKQMLYSTHSFISFCEQTVICNYDRCDI